MKRYIIASALLVSTFTNAKADTQLNKTEILEILQKSANTKKYAKGQRPQYEKPAGTTIEKNTVGNQGYPIRANSTRDAEISSGIIKPSDQAGIYSKTSDPYKNLPFGSLPNVSIESHNTANGITLEKRFQSISGEPVVVEKKARVAQIKKAKVPAKKIDPVDRLY